MLRGGTIVAVLVATCALLFGATTASAGASTCVGSNSRTVQGAGTADSPYLIVTADDLRAVGTGSCGLGATYLQTADITMPAPTEGGGIESNFTPIGTAGNPLGTMSDPFTGVFDGGGHSIANLVYVDSRVNPSEGGVGLFGSVDLGGAVRRVHLTAVRLGGGSFVGALAGVVGLNGSVQIDDVSTTGSVTGGAYVGGLIGTMKSEGGTTTRIAGAHADVAVAASGVGGGGNANAGGLIGNLVVRSNGAVTIDNVTSDGDVTAEALFAGGLVGIVAVIGGAPPAGVGVGITDAIVRGSVTSSAHSVGGLIGLVQTSGDGRSVRLARVAAHGAVSAVGLGGGLVGRIAGQAAVDGGGRVEIDDAYADGPVTRTVGSGYMNFGGLIGVLDSDVDQRGTIALGRIYASGRVSPVGHGLLGAESGSTFTYEGGGDALWDIQATGQAESGMPKVRAQGLTTSAMQQRATYAGWPMVYAWQTPAADRMWGICTSVNGGYPFLLAEYDAMPCQAPSPPTGLSARVGNAMASIDFTPGASDGVPVTDYAYSFDGGTTWTSAGTGSSPITLTGLTNGTTYQVRLRATTAAGTSPASDAVAVTPVAPVTTPVPAATADPLALGQPKVLPGGRVAVRVTVAGPGVFLVTGTIAGGRAAKPVCTTKRTVKKAGAYTLTCAVNSATRARLRTSRLKLRLTVAFTPKGGVATRETSTVMLPRGR